MQVKFSYPGFRCPQATFALKALINDGSASSASNNDACERNFSFLKNTIACHDNIIEYVPGRALPGGALARIPSLHNVPAFPRGNRRFICDFRDEVPDVVLALLPPEAQAVLEPVNPVTGQKERLRAQYYVLGLHARSLDDALSLFKVEVDGGGGAVI